MRLTCAIGLALMTGVGLGGCMAHTAASEAPTTDEAEQAYEQAVTELREHHRHHHRGGVTQLIAMSLDTLDVDEVNSAQVEKLHGELHACMAPAGGVEKKLLLALADGIAAGAIATAEVDAALAQRSTAAAAVHDCSIDILNKLHAILSPMERATLVDKVEAHWEVWRQSNHESEAGRRERGGRLADLAQEVSLTEDQIEKMSAALGTALAGRPAKFDPAKAEAHVQAFVTGFAGESFDARSIATNANALLATHGGSQMVLFYETVTPLLTPEQRTTLAEHLREHASQQPTISTK